MAVIEFATRHPWSVTTKDAITIQKQLADSVRSQPLTQTPRFIAGVDCAFSNDKQYCYASSVLWDNQQKKLIEQHNAREKLYFPYIPGLLSFREAPAMLAALRQLTRRPDVIIVDGQGIAHPRRLGIASHIGVLTDIPTIGCAKSRLVGSYTEPAATKGSRNDLRYVNQIIGSVLRTRNNVRPLFISIGNNIDLANAENVIIQCTHGYRLPEPTRLADKSVGEYKKAGNKL